MVRVVPCPETEGMQIASLEINVVQAGLLVSNAMLIAAAGIWLLLMTGVAGRIALLVEEMPHRRDPKPQCTSHLSRPTSHHQNP